MSHQQNFFDDVEVGQVLPPLTKGPLTIKDLVKFGVATHDYSEIHFDEVAAHTRGLPAPVVHGPLKAAFLAQMLTGWAGPDGGLKRLSCQYRRMDVAGETITCLGKVTGKSAEDHQGIVECEIWTENSTGEITTRGTAVLALPRRARSREEPSVSVSSAPDPNPISLITDAMRRHLRLGEVAGVFTYEVDRKWVQQFVDAFEDANPLWSDEEYARAEGLFGGTIAPPTFFAALDPVERRDLLLDEWVETIPYKNTGGGNAFNEVEYYLPIRVGDSICVEVTYTEIYERDGRTGRLLFRIRENVLRNQRGEVVARVRNGHVRSYDLSKKKDE
jgi:acyl dehydratase